MNRNHENGRWVLISNQLQWMFTCGCRAKTPDSFWVNSCETHSLLNK